MDINNQQYVSDSFIDYKKFKFNERKFIYIDEVYGDTWQDSNNLSDIRSVGVLQSDGRYKLSISTCGKNLFDGVLVAGDISQTTGNVIVGNSHAVPQNYINVCGNTQYYLNYTYSVLPAWTVVFEYDVNKQFIGCNSILKQFTTKSNTRFLKFKIENVANVNIKDLQLEQGAVATTFEAYKGDKVSIYLPCQLEKVGTVADRLFRDIDGVWKIEKKIIRKTLTSSMTTAIVNPTGLSTDCIGFEFSNSVNSLSQYDTLICSRFSKSIAGWGTPSNVFINNTTNIACIVPKLELETQDQDGIKKWINKGLFEVVYKCKNPTLIKLPLNTQLILNSFVSETNIFTSDTLISPNVKIKYFNIDTYDRWNENYNSPSNEINYTQNEKQVDEDSYIEINEITGNTYKNLTVNANTEILLKDKFDYTFTGTKLLNTPIVEEKIYLDELSGNTLVNLNETGNDTNVFMDVWYKDTSICNLSKLKVSRYTYVAFLDKRIGAINSYNFFEFGIGDNALSSPIYPNNNLNSVRVAWDSNIKVGSFDITNEHLASGYSNLVWRPVRRADNPVVGENVTYSVRLVIVEGDYTNTNLNYFNGISGVGDFCSNENRYEVEMLSYDNITPTVINKSYDTHGQALDGLLEIQSIEGDTFQNLTIGSGDATTLNRDIGTITSNNGTVVIDNTSDDKVRVGLQGNTMVNFKEGQYTNNQNSGFFLQKINSGVKGKKVTLIVNVPKSTSYTQCAIYRHKDNIAISPFLGYSVKNLNKPIVLDFSTETITDFDYYVIYVQNHDGTQFVTLDTTGMTFMVVEGDYTTNPPSYFEGIQSVGVTRFKENELGSYITVNNSLDESITNIEILGNTVQGTTLSDIKSVGTKQPDGQYKLSILSCGKNLFDGVLVVGDIKSSTGISTSDTTHAISQNFISVGGNKQYTINYTYSVLPKWYSVFEYDINKQYIGYIDNTKQFTTKPNTRFLKFKIENALNVVIKDTQIEQGAVATTYEPYKSNKCDILLPCQLEKVGTVADRLYYDTTEKAWCIEKNIQTKTLNGSEVWVYENGYDSLNCATFTLVNLSTNLTTAISDVICSSFQTTTFDSFTSKDYEFICKNSTGKIFIHILKTKASSLTSFTSLLQTNNILVKYVQATPQKIILPLSTQIQLNAYYGITNIFTQDTIIEPTIKAVAEVGVDTNKFEINSIDSDGNLFDGNYASVDSNLKFVGGSFIPVITGQIYSLCNDTPISMYMAFYDSNKQLIRYNYSVPTTPPPTVIESSKGSGFYINLYDGINSNLPTSCETFKINDSRVKYIKIVKASNDTIVPYMIKGATVIPYQPYKINTKQIQYYNSSNQLVPLINLRRVNDWIYDEIIERNGKYYYIKRCEKIILNGNSNELWAVRDFSTPTNYLYCESATYDSLIKSNVNTCVSDRFTSTGAFDSNIILNGEYITTTYTSNKIRFSILKTKLTTLDDVGLKTWLRNNPITMIVPLATPIEYECVGLDLNSYSNQTTVSISQNVIPTTLTVKNNFYLTKLLQPSTEYTLYFVAFKNGSTSDININLGGAIKTITNANILNENKISITTPATLESDKLKITGSGIKVNNIMLFQGQVSKSIPYYFEDIQSSFEDKNVVIESVGKNLFDGVLENGGLSINGGVPVSLNDAKRSANFIKVYPNRNYAISFSSGEDKANIFEYDKDKNCLGRIGFVNRFTTSKNTYYIKFYNLPYDTSIKIQIEENITNTTYEPYKNSRIQFTIPNPLRRIGTVFDRLVIKNKKIYIERNIGKVVLNGSESMWNVTDFTTPNNYLYCETNSLDSLILSDSNICICNKFKTFRYGFNVTSNSINDEYIITTYTVNKLRLSILKSRLSSLDSTGFKTWLSQNNVTVYYQLATPTYEEVTYPNIFNTLKLDYFANGTINQNSIIPSNMNSNLYIKGDNDIVSINQQLHGFGGVYDRLYWDKNKGYYCIEKKIGKVVLNGSENAWSVQMDFLNQTNTMGFRFNNLSDGLDGDGNNVGVCNSFFVCNQRNLHTNDSEGYTQGYKSIYIRILKSKLTTQDLAGFKTWLASNNVTIIYQLATPQIIDLPQYNIPNSVSTQNNIYLINNVSPTTTRLSNLCKLYFIKDLKPSTKYTVQLDIDSNGTSLTKVVVDLGGSQVNLPISTGLNTYKVEITTSSSFTYKELKLYGKNIKVKNTLLFEGGTDQIFSYFEGVETSGIYNRLTNTYNYEVYVQNGIYEIESDDVMINF